MEKDWIGNKRTTFAQLGASSHTEKEREEHDFYATDPVAAEGLLEVLDLDKNILEPACGLGHLSEVFKAAGHNVESTDLIDRGYGKGEENFLLREEPWDGDIVTNPPYKYAEEFVRKALELVPAGKKVVMFLRIQFLEGQKRRKLFEDYPPKYVLVASKRIVCAINGDFAAVKGSAAAYCWIVWEKGFTGNTQLNWFN